MNRTTRGPSAARVAPLLVALALLAACDTAPGPPPLAPAPPVVSDLRLEPAAASVDTLAQAEAGVVVPLQLTLDAQPGDAPLARVAYAVQWQFACQQSRLDASGEFEAVGDGRYVAAPALEVPPGRRGAYRVAAWAVDASGLPSNEIGAAFHLEGVNQGPPVIEEIQAPTEITPPANLRFVVRVDDPDGVDNIARAEVSLPGAGTLPLSDTDQAGNNTPCDGTYSASFTVPAGAEPGLVTFTFRAFDRDGAASAPVPFTVQILE
jgi:hypothetical protein